MGKDFEQHSSEGPYYCHWLVWRLGTWGNEDFFNFFNYLLGFGRKLKGWNENKYGEVANDPSWNRFWSLLWELQVAKALGNLQNVTEIAWLQSGPDLKVTTTTSRNDPPVENETG